MYNNDNLSSFTLIDKNNNETYFGDHNVYIGGINKGFENENLIPPTNVISESVAGMDGEYFFGSHLKSRPIPIKCFFEFKTEQELNDIQQLLYRSEPTKLIMDESPYKYIWVVSEQEANVNHVRRNGKHSGYFEMEYTAHDPRYYSVFTSLDIYSVLNNDIRILKYLDENNGLPFDNYIQPASFTNIVESSTFILYNGGSYKSKCKITCVGSGTSLVFTNLANDETFTISAMTAETVIVDGERGQVRNETILKTDLFDGDFIMLEPGDNIVTLVSGDVNLSEIDFDYKYTYTYALN